jgi:hypothetical protein
MVPVPVKLETDEVKLTVPPINVEAVGFGEMLTAGGGGARTTTVLMPDVAVKPPPSDTVQEIVYVPLSVNVPVVDELFPVMVVDAGEKVNPPAGPETTFHV